MNLRPIILIGTILGSLALLACSNSTTSSPTAPGGSMNATGQIESTTSTPRVEIISATGNYSQNEFGCAFLGQNGKITYQLFFKDNKAPGFPNGVLVTAVGEVRSPVDTPCGIDGTQLIVQQITLLKPAVSQPTPTPPPQS